MYRPRLRYYFCVMRQTSMRSQLSLIRYLNLLDIVPYLNWDGNWEKEISSAVKKSGVKYKRKRTADGKSDYDVVFSESTGVTRFEKTILQEGMIQGKTNIKLNNSISIDTSVINTVYTPNKTRGMLHGIFLKGQRTVDHFKKFTKGLFFINGGDPDWDQFSTDDFKSQVKITNSKYGDRFLVIGLTLHHKEEWAWCEKIVRLANEKKIKTIIRIHPGLEHNANKLSKSTQRHVDNVTPYYVLLASSSHAIVNIQSTMVAECLYLGKIVGCSPFIGNFIKYGKPHMWIEDHKKWSNAVISKTGNIVHQNTPRITTARDLNEFLSTNKPSIDQNEVDLLFGWKRLPSYSGHLFEEVEKIVI